jgi:transcriptional regulator with XRE-family HTH domain
LSGRNFLMSTGKFDGPAFYSAIDGQRLARKLTWKRVADEAGVPASTLTRMSQGRRPDVDSLASLCTWSGLHADDFFRHDGSARVKPEALAQITAHLRADPKLSLESIQAIETLIKTAYQQFRKS